ncbi:MAG: ABC transporter ATP-binding protein [Polyangiaceae bacterium]
MDDPAPALRAGGVSARYDENGALALDDVSFDLKRGELVAVLGPNGAGKTTLVRLLSGIQKTTSGNVTIFGVPIDSLERAAVAKKIAVVRQTEPIAFGFSVREIVMMGRAPHQTGWLRATREDEQIVNAAMKRMDVLDLADRQARELSGGEARRVAIARAFAQAPEILLLDEPGAFLDVRHQLALYDRLASEVKENSLACLVVMHDLNMATQYADRIVLLQNGKLIACGSPANVMTEARVHEVFGARLLTGVDSKSNAPYFLPVRESAAK